MSDFTKRRSDLEVPEDRSNYGRTPFNPVIPSTFILCHVFLFNRSLLSKSSSIQHRRESSQHVKTIMSYRNKRAPVEDQPVPLFRENKQREAQTKQKGKP